MSRSYKKTPGWKDCDTWAKRQANKKVRKRWDIDDGGAYRKVYDRYNICDWKCLLFENSDLRRIEEIYGEQVYRAWIK